MTETTVLKDKGISTQNEMDDFAFIHVRTSLGIEQP